MHCHYHRFIGVGRELQILLCSQARLNETTGGKSDAKLCFSPDPSCKLQEPRATRRKSCLTEIWAPNSARPFHQLILLTHSFNHWHLNVPLNCADWKVWGATPLVVRHQVTWCLSLRDTLLESVLLQSTGRDKDDGPNSLSTNCVHDRSVSWCHRNKCRFGHKFDENLDPLSTHPSQVTYALPISLISVLPHHPRQEWV